MDLDADPKSAAIRHRCATLTGRGQPFDGHRPPDPGIPYRSLDRHCRPLGGPVAD
ncbi:MAG: hypothetical protein ACT6T0_00460 [Nevskia sp.]